jgi:uncharacterized membrane protein
MYKRGVHMARRRKAKKKAARRKAARRRPAAKEAGGSQSTGWAFIGSLPILGFILVYLARKKDKYAMFYAKQGLVLGVAYLVINFLLTLLVITIPLTFIWSLICFILWIITAVNAFSGKTKPTPWVGRYARRL